MENDKASRELSQKLSQLLELAADGEEGAPEAFFEALLEAEVWIPLSGDSEATDIEVGGKGAGEGSFKSVEYEGHKCIPIFTEEPFVEQWAELEVPCAKKKFSSLLWLLGEETWLYLNAAQPVGKEITSWEIEQLKKGVDAIPDVIQAVNELILGDIEVRSERDVYPEFKKAILSILEVYADLEEAFVISVKEDAGSVEKPVVGIRWNKKANEGKRAYVRSELEQVVSDIQPGGAETVFIIDDLEDLNSPNQSLFVDATPFYFKQKVVPTESIVSAMCASVGSWLSKLCSPLFRVFQGDDSSKE